MSETPAIASQVWHVSPQSPKSTPPRFEPCPKAKDVADVSGRRLRWRGCAGCAIQVLQGLVGFRDVSLTSCKMDVSLRYRTNEESPTAPVEDSGLWGAGWDSGVLKPVSNGTKRVVGSEPVEKGGGLDAHGSWGGRRLEASSFIEELAWPPQRKFSSVALRLVTCKLCPLCHLLCPDQS